MLMDSEWPWLKPKHPEHNVQIDLNIQIWHFSLQELFTRCGLSFPSGEGAGSSLGMSWTQSQMPASQNSQVPGGNHCLEVTSHAWGITQTSWGREQAEPSQKSSLLSPSLGLLFTQTQVRSFTAMQNHLKIPGAAQVPTTNSLLRAKFNPLSDPARGISLSITAWEAIS